MGRERAVAAILAGAWLSLAAPAQATLVPVEVDLRIVYSDLPFLLPVGSQTTLSLTIDDGRPDGDAAPERGSFTSVGSAELAIIPGFLVPLASVMTSQHPVGTDVWRGRVQGTFGEPGGEVSLDVLLDLTGTLVDPGQPVPRFVGPVAGLQSGVVFLGQFLFLNSEVTALRILPEPGSLTLFSVGLVALALRRRRSHAAATPEKPAAIVPCESSE